MLAISGPQLSRRNEVAALVLTVLAAVTTVIAPVLYVVLLPATCAAVGAVAPAGRRIVTGMVVWFPVSLGVVLGAGGIG